MTSETTKTHPALASLKSRSAPDLPYTIFEAPRISPSRAKICTPEPEPVLVRTICTLKRTANVQRRKSRYSEVKKVPMGKIVPERPSSGQMREGVEEFYEREGQGIVEIVGWVDALPAYSPSCSPTYSPTEGGSGEWGEEDVGLGMRKVMQGLGCVGKERERVWWAVKGEAARLRRVDREAGDDL